MKTIRLVGLYACAYIPPLCICTGILRPPWKHRRRFSFFGEDWIRTLKRKTTPMKQSAIIPLLTVALFTTSSLMAARPNRYAQHNRYHAKITQTARGGQRQTPSTASKTAPLTGIEAFVEKHLLSAKRPRQWSDEKVLAAFAKVQASPNYDVIPPQYRALIEANKENCAFGSGGTSKPLLGARF